MPPVTPTGTVIDITSRMPHLVITCDENHTHVLPASWILQYLSRDPAAASLPECMKRRIVGEWYEQLTRT